MPEEDQGYFLAHRAGAGGRVAAVHRRASRGRPRRSSWRIPTSWGSSRSWASASAARRRTRGSMFASLKPFDEREGRRALRCRRCSAACCGQLLAIPGAIIVSVRAAVDPRPRPFGGFEFQVLDQTGTDINALAAATYAMAGAGNQSPRLRGLFTSVHRNDPQLLGARSIGSARSRSGCRSARSRARCRSSWARSTSTTSSSTTAPIASTCRPTRQFRSSPQGLKQLYVRTRTGQMVPLESVVRDRGDDRAAGHQPLQPVPVGDDQRIGGARRQLGRGAAGDGGARGARRCRRA